jgi:hypothetical protein
MKRLVNTNKTNIDRTKRFIQDALWSRKPWGLWYSIGNDWLNWCNDNRPDWICKNIIELNIEVGKLIVIKTVDDLKAFQIAFENPCDDNEFANINWSKVAEQYSGIEVRNFSKIKEEMDWLEQITHWWFIGLDVSSGCIWDLSIIRSYKTREVDIEDFIDPQLELAF